MPTLDESFPAIAKALGERYGRAIGSSAMPDEPFTAMIAVIVDRVADARKRARALAELTDAGFAEPQALAEADPDEITELLRSAGIATTPKVVGPIRRLAAWVVDRYHGSVEELSDAGTSRLRDELASVNGIGPATADAILLHAWRRPVYPVDRVTYRVAVRHGWLDPSADYDEARSTIERPLGDDPLALAHFSAWMEQVGREYCRASSAKCEHCPLKPFLPEGGPLEPEAV